MFGRPASKWRADFPRVLSMFGSKDTLDKLATSTSSAIPRSRLARRVVLAKKVGHLERSVSIWQDLCLSRDQKGETRTRLPILRTVLTFLQSMSPAGRSDRASRLGRVGVSMHTVLSILITSVT